MYNSNSSWTQFENLSDGFGNWVTFHEIGKRRLTHDGDGKTNPFSNVTCRLLMMTTNLRIKGKRKTSCLVYFFSCRLWIIWFRKFNENNMKCRRHHYDGYDSIFSFFSFRCSRSKTNKFSELSTDQIVVDRSRRCFSKCSEINNLITVFLPLCV